MLIYIYIYSLMLAQDYHGHIIVVKLVIDVVVNHNTGLES